MHKKRKRVCVSTLAIKGHDMGMCDSTLHPHGLGHTNGGMPKLKQGFVAWKTYLWQRLRFG